MLLLFAARPAGRAGHRAFLFGLRRCPVLPAAYGSVQILAIVSLEFIHAWPAVSTGQRVDPGKRGWLADGSRKPIRDVRVGDRVRATDPASGRTEDRTVMAVIVGEGDKTLVAVTVRTDEGQRVITATDHHPFWDQGAHDWVAAVDLHPGDVLRTPDGALVPVVGTRVFHRVQRVFNLTVEGLHTYYVKAGTTPVLVHNSCGPDGSTDANENFIPGSAEGQKLADALRLESANSPFAVDGVLTPEAIGGSREIIPGVKLGNRALQERFAQSGGMAQSGSDVRFRLQGGHGPEVSTDDGQVQGC